MRSTLGILTLAVLAAAAPASIQNYRVSGTFDFADGDGDFENLAGTDFAFEFAYDTDAPNLGDEFSAAYPMRAVGLQTGFGGLGGVGVATVDLDPEFGSVAFGATAQVGENEFMTYGLILDRLAPQTGALPIDLSRLYDGSNGTFFLVGGDGGVQNLTGAGTASASKLSIQTVPEPASMAALAVGAVGLLRRRRA